MKVLNRSYLQITPKLAFWELVKTKSEDSSFMDFHEPSIYLIKEDFWDETELLNTYWKKISHFEFEQILESSSEDLIPNSLEEFKGLFTYNIGGTVVDCIKEAPERL